MQCEVNSLALVHKMHSLNISHFLHNSLFTRFIAGLPAARLLCADGHMPALHQGDLIDCDRGCPENYHCEAIARYGACCPDNIDEALQLWRKNNIRQNSSNGAVVNGNSIEQAEGVDTRRSTSCTFLLYTCP
jgi:hypothetical protein